MSRPVRYTFIAAFGVVLGLGAIAGVRLLARQMAGSGATTTKPHLQDLVGTYELTPETRDWLSKDLGESVRGGTLEVKTNGTYVMQGVPYYFGDTNLPPIRQEGTWEFAYAGDGWSLELLLENDASRMPTVLFLRRNQPPYQLYAPVGAEYGLIFEPSRRSPTPRSS